MRLADLRLAVRPRRPLEATDLGVRLVQAEAAAVWRAWFSVTLPVLLLALAVTLATGGLGTLLLWWLKPLYDLAVQQVLSRRVFGDDVPPRASLRLFASAWRHGLAGHLLWRRLSMSRAYLLPVWLLEQLPAGERRERLALLRRHQGGQARSLHVAMAQVELCLALALLSLLFWFAPQGAVPDLWALLTEDANRATQLITLLAVYAAMSLTEPFYAGAGFSLYLNRRTELEAWDLELAFRQLRARLAGPGGPA